MCMEYVQYGSPELVHDAMCQLAYICLRVRGSYS